MCTAQSRRCTSTNNRSGVGHTCPRSGQSVIYQLEVEGDHHLEKWAGVGQSYHVGNCSKYTISYLLWFAGQSRYRYFQTHVI